MLKRLARALGITFALGLAVLAGVVLRGYAEARRMPVPVEASAPLPGLPPGSRLRILHITDTHVSLPDMPRARLERIVAEANALKPDLIVLTGDYLSLIHI